MTPFKRNTSRGVSVESTYFTAVRPDCKKTECEIKAELRQKMREREQKDGTCRNQSSKGDQTPQNSDLEEDAAPGKQVSNIYEEEEVYPPSGGWTTAKDFWWKNR